MLSDFSKFPNFAVDFETIPVSSNFHCKSENCAITGSCTSTLPGMIFYSRKCRKGIVHTCISLSCSVAESIGERTTLPMFRTSILDIQVLIDRLRTVDYQVKLILTFESLVSLFVCSQQGVFIMFLSRFM